MLTLIPCVTIQRMEAAVKELGHGDSAFGNRISALTLKGKLSVVNIYAHQFWSKTCTIPELDTI